MVNPLEKHILNDFLSFAPELLLLIFTLTLVLFFSFISTKKEYPTLINFSSNFVIYNLILIAFLFLYDVINYKTLQKTFYNNTLVLDNN